MPAGELVLTNGTLAMAFSRHNIEKRRLIELVRHNPILWDCRLPHYKRSDKKKAIKWNELGRMFNVNGERVQRTFTSLREIFRRELNHEKMLGTTRFKSKWEYYDAMAFLKEVIRERKSRERIKHSSMESAASNNNTLNNNNTTNTPNSNNNNNNNTNSNNSSSNNNNSVTHDEYQYFAPSDPNNPNNQANKSNQLATALQQPPTAPPSTPVAATVPASLVATALLPNLSQLPVALQQQAQHLQALQLQPDVTLTSLKTTSATAGAATTIALPLVTLPPATSPAHSCSSSPSIYIKDEPDSPDEEESRSAHKSQQKLATIRAQTKQQLKARLQVQEQAQAQGQGQGQGQSNKGSGAVYATPPPHLIINTNNELIDVDAGDLDDDDDDLEYDDDDDEVDDDEIDGGMGGRRGGNCPPLVDVDMLGTGDRLSPGSSFTAAGMGSRTPRHQTSPREMLYIKFGDFLAARLNTLHDSTANELMNKILLLIAEK